MDNSPLIILANKRSRGYRDVYRRHLLNVFAKRRKAPIYYLSANHAEMFSLLKPQIKSARQIIIAGGDGTFESAINCPLFHHKSLGFFPLGAGNSFYSYFYKGKRFEYLRGYFQFQETELDVLELQWNNQKIQTLFCSAGIDAEVIRLSKDRSQHGFFDYFIASCRALLTARARFPLQVAIDKKSYYFPNCINLTLGKVPYYGYGLRSLLSPINPTDNLIYGLAYLGNTFNWFNKLIRLCTLSIVAFDSSCSGLRPLKGGIFTINSNISIPIQAGGEFLGYASSLSLRVIRQQRVLTI